MGFIFVFFKFSLYFIKDQVITAYKRVKGYFHAFIISVLDTEELLLSSLATIIWEEGTPVFIKKEAGRNGLLLNDLYPKMEYTVLPVLDSHFRHAHTHTHTHTHIYIYICGLLDGAFSTSVYVRSKVL
jgi:hypothetical protein